MMDNWDTIHSILEENYPEVEIQIVQEQIFFCERLLGTSIVPREKLKVIVEIILDSFDLYEKDFRIATADLGVWVD